MKILYVHQYFCTPDESGGTRSYWISKELVKRGHQVTVITSTKRSHPDACRIQMDGFDVVYVKNPSYDNFMSAPRKIWAFVAFIKNAIKTGMKEKDVDLVFATSTPLTVGAIALWLKWRKKWKYVFEVRDLIVRMLKGNIDIRRELQIIEDLNSEYSWENSTTKTISIYNLLTH